MAIRGDQAPSGFVVRVRVPTLLCHHRRIWPLGRLSPTIRSEQPFADASAFLGPDPFVAAHHQLSPCGASSHGAVTCGELGHKVAFERPALPDCTLTPMRRGANYPSH